MVMNLRPILILVAVITTAALQGQSPAPRVPDNPSIDIDGFLRVAGKAAAHRESRRISEADFLRMSAEPGTIVLDARSREKYEQLHIDGAVHLSFPDITYESLARLIPDKSTRILIYCNNNFRNEERAFPTKAPTAALNISTYVSLYDYGYRNIFELGPLIDVKETRLRLVSSN
jgi:phage shock protein E